MSIENVNVEIDPCRLTKGAGQCDGFRFSIFVDDNLIATGMGETIADAAQWCDHNVRRVCERALESVQAMGLKTDTPQAYLDRQKAKNKETP